jgi:hypothetical protein
MGEWAYVARQILTTPSRAFLKAHTRSSEFPGAGRGLNSLISGGRLKRPPPSKEQPGGDTKKHHPLLKQLSWAVGDRQSLLKLVEHQGGAQEQHRP